jgi:hypothetical protein
MEVEIEGMRKGDNMPRRGKKYTEEMAFFINDKNRIEYHSLCKGCVRECKQSYKVLWIGCPIYVSAEQEEKTQNR